MTGQDDIGRTAFLLGIAGFGLQALASTAPVPGLEPLPAWAPVQAVADLTGLLLVAAAAGLAFRVSRRWAAWGLALLLLAWAALLHAPRLLAAPGDGGGWSQGFIVLALAGAALVVAGVPRGRLAYGLALVAFGVIHLIYHKAISGMIPAWIPGRPWWPYLTGLANLAAGLALLSGIRAGLAGIMVGLMYAAWIVLIHIPAVAAAPSDPGEWNRLLIAVALAGGAWVVAAVPAVVGFGFSATSRVDQAKA